MKKICSIFGERQSDKLALAGEQEALWPGADFEEYAPEVLDLEPWTEDSGISSDDTIDSLRRSGESSGVESSNGSLEQIYTGQLQLVKLKMKDFENDRATEKSSNEEQADFQGNSESDRASPPLYEVELTASDEDDDASVLELVIPMQSSRYQRVPTSSPKKTKPKVVKRYFCSLMCCGRTRK